MANNTVPDQSWMIGITERPKKSQEAWLGLRIIRALKKMNLAGIRNALKPEVDWREKFYWVGAFLFCLGLSIFLTVYTINEYGKNPILYTFHDDELIYKVPFPGTTITGTAVLKKNAVEDSLGLYFNTVTSETGKYELDGKIWTSHLVDLLIFYIDHFCVLVKKSFSTHQGYINKHKVEQFNFQNDPGWAKAKNIHLIDNPEGAGIKENIVPFLKDKTLDCKNILLACLWEGEKKECSELFVPIQTDVGSGCSFNRIPEKVLRKHQSLMSLFHHHTYPDEEFKAWEKFVSERMESVISVNGVSDFVDLVHPRAQRHPGKLRGLSFMVKFDKGVNGMSCPIVDSNGYLLGIHSPFEEPRMLQTGVTIPPMHEVFVNVKADVTIADKDIKNLGISRRKCYFQDENPLKNFKVYTQGNCQNECLGNAIHNSCNCTLLTRSAGKNETLCGPVQHSCVQSATENLEKGKYDKLCRNPVCYPPCDDVKYSAEASYLPYYKDDIFDMEKLKNENVTSIVHVAFDSDSVSTKQRKLNFGFSILLGVLGGIWGMTFEFSVFTVFDILAGIGVLIFSYWICPSLENEEEGNDIHLDEESPAEKTLTNEVDAGGSSGPPPCVLTIKNEQESPPSDQGSIVCAEDNLGDEDTSSRAENRNNAHEIDYNTVASCPGSDFNEIGQDSSSNLIINESEYEDSVEHEDQSSQLAPEQETPECLLTDSTVVDDSPGTSTMENALADPPDANGVQTSLPDSQETLILENGSVTSNTRNDATEGNITTDTEYPEETPEARKVNLENPEVKTEQASALQGSFDLARVVEELLELKKLSNDFSNPTTS